MTGGDWLEVARRVAERHAAEYRNADGTWTTEWPEFPSEADEIFGVTEPPAGLLLDAFTASMLVQVHERLDLGVGARFEALSLERAIDVGWKAVA